MLPLFVVEEELPTEDSVFFGFGAAITDASVTERIHFLPDPFTPDHARALLRAGGGAGRFHGIWSREGTALLGAIGVHPAPHRREVEIGYWLSPAARGRHGGAGR